MTFQNDSLMTSHPDYRTTVCIQVLIIGGGDGGVLREVVKHPLVASVVQCEIDEVCVKQRIISKITAVAHSSLEPLPSQTDEVVPHG